MQNNTYESGNKPRFLIDLPVISEEQITILDAPSPKGEIPNALTKLQSGKSPGPGGFECEFYEKFQNLLLDPYLAMLNYSAETGILPQSLREAKISKGNVLKIVPLIDQLPWHWHWVLRLK